jgi:hypothetical protein
MISGNFFLIFAILLISVCLINGSEESSEEDGQTDGQKDRQNSKSELNWHSSLKIILYDHFGAESNGFYESNVPSTLSNYFNLCTEFKKRKSSSIATEQ